MPGSNDPNDPINTSQGLNPQLGGEWEGGIWHNSASDDPNGLTYKNWQQAYADKQRQVNDPNSPYNQANALGSKETMLLGRQAPGIAQVDQTGLEQARGNQLGALGAQRSLMAGPSLAGMKANQAFGQAQQNMMSGSRDPRSMAMAMRGGAGQLGAAAGNAGNAVGQEWMQGQKGIANSINTLGQGDIASQTAMQKLQAQQQQLYLTQRQQNLGAAQGYEQNYYDLQNAYTQAAQAALAAKYKQQQDQQQQQLQIGGGIMSAIPFIGGAGAAAMKGGANSAIDGQGQDPNG